MSVVIPISRLYPEILRVLPYAFIKTPSSAGIDAFVDTALDTFEMANPKSVREHEIFIVCIFSCLFIIFLL